MTRKTSWRRGCWYSLVAVLLVSLGVLIGVKISSTPKVEISQIKQNSDISATHRVLSTGKLPAIESVYGAGATIKNVIANSTGCIYILAFGGLTNKLNIAANGNHLKSQGHNVCAYLWEDGADQSLPRSSNKRLSVPPIDIPYLLEEPMDCDYYKSDSHLNLTAVVQIPKFEKCLILDDLFLASVNTIKESIFDLSFKMPFVTPNITTCIHLRLEPDMNLQIDEKQAMSVIKPEDSVLILGDPKYISKETLRRNHYYHTVSSDATAILAYCTCKGKKFYGSEYSSLSHMICASTTQCDWIQRTPLMARYEDEFRKLNVNC